MWENLQEVIVLETQVDQQSLRGRLSYEHVRCIMARDPFVQPAPPCKLGIDQEDVDMGHLSVQLSERYFSETLFAGDRLPDYVRMHHVSFSWSKVRLDELIIGPEVFSVQEFFMDGSGDGSGSEE